MGRKKRIWYEGAIYHIFNRGNNKQNIFRDAKDRTFFLGKLNNSIEEHRIKIHAYCLMPNHYHLLLETSDVNISETMHIFLTNYSKHYNYKYNFSGHLFQGRYKSILVEKDNYLLEVSRYIHLNPVEAKLVKQPEHYPYTSLRYYIDPMLSPPLKLHTETILRYFKNEQKLDEREAYLKFVLNKIGKDYSLEEYITKDDILGSQSFVKEVQEKYGRCLAPGKWKYFFTKKGV